MANTRTPSASDAGDADASSNEDNEYSLTTRKFWKGNLRLTVGLLFVWALAGLGCGILFADRLNETRLAGYPLGFWFAQQGSIIAFVFIILLFCILSNARDKKHHAEYLAIKNRKEGAE